jgi:predicted methyltransferase
MHLHETDISDADRDEMPIYGGHNGDRVEFSHIDIERDNIDVCRNMGYFAIDACMHGNVEVDELVGP